MPSFGSSTIDDFKAGKPAVQRSSFHLCLRATTVGAFEALAACCYFKKDVESLPRIREFGLGI